MTLSVDVNSGLKAVKSVGYYDMKVVYITPTYSENSSIISISFLTSASRDGHFLSSLTT